MHACLKYNNIKWPELGRKTAAEYYSVTNRLCNYCLKHWGPSNLPMNKVISLSLNGGGKPKKIIGETIKQDLALNGFVENLVSNRAQRCPISM